MKKIVPVTLSLLMSFIILFFVVLMNNFSVSSLVYGGFLIYLFTAMTFSESKEKGSGVKYRRIFQILFAVFFCIAFIGDLYAERKSMAITEGAMSNSELPFCHIAIPQVLIPFIITGNLIFPARIAGHYASVSSMLCIWLILTFTVGRGWCSWVCFYGGWEEGFSHVSKKRKLNLVSKNKEIREFQFAFLAFIALASIGAMSAVYCQWFCPFKLVTEFSPINSIPSLISAVMFIGLFLGLVVIMPILTKRRIQCSSLCPFGAMASLLNGISPFKIKIETDKCKGCMKCANACLFGAIDITTIQNKKGRPELTCSKCGECIGVCPEKAIGYAFKFEKKCDRVEAKTKFAKVIQAFLDPAELFRFAAFTFAVIMSSNFVIKALNLIFKEIVK